jgi:hypothetical protein
VSHNKEHAMTRETADIVIMDFLKEISQRLDQTVSIAKAAEACADAGNPKQAVEIVMDVEPLIFDANTLLNGATLLQHGFRPDDLDCD